MTHIPLNWRSIAALNATSTLAQVAQFGIPFVVLPLWLEQQGASTLALSLYAASLWCGQLPGLALSPRWTRRLGPARVILLALVCTLLGFGSLGLGLHCLWVPAGLLAGFGQGLRWIALEPWLYGLTPPHAQGRWVGFHETLIALAPVIAPWLVSHAGLSGSAPLWIGVGFALAAALPLAAAGAAPTEIEGDVAGKEATTSPYWLQTWEPILVLGALSAVFGGITEGAIVGLFPVLGPRFQLDSAQLAALLASFGAGGLFLQFAAGWLADHCGLRVASLGCSVGTALLAMLLLTPLPPMLLHIVVFGLGGLVTAGLTLALIASAQVQQGSVTQSMSLLSMVYTLSAAAGPVVAGLNVHWIGNVALPLTVSGLSLLLAAFLARHKDG